MLTRRQTLAAAMAAPVAVPLAAPRLARAQQGQPYVVGTLFPMAGPNAEYGGVFTAGVQMALDHIAADRMLGRPVELRAQDSQGTPQGGATGMTKLASVDRANYVLVGFTGVSKAAAPIAARAKVPMVNGGGVGPDLAGLSPYFWNVIPLVNLEVRALLPWLGRSGLKKIALIYVDDPFGNAILAELRRGLPEVGASLVGTFSVPPGSQQFAAVAAKVRDAGADAVYFASYGAQQSQIIKQLRDNGVSQQLLTYSGATLASVAALPEAEGLVFTRQAADWSSDDPVTKRFVTDWRAKHGGDPGSYHQNYYNGTRLFALLAQGLEKQNRPVDGDGLRAELLRVREFAFVGGKASFDDQGCVTMPIEVNKLQGGQYVRLS
ncbi:ABC transporter substrate-binding protein [Roseomonas sp. NAR14]|uniref:ABC transporter substrate-binding protein n=1 Tax=Roseomonas acroporae TaxID=2937791 RepID=A0A9X2BTH1_9PROT|nr:ABC transporter substrate-binding protein [Roseomonas acroporae]MCK8783206.1 ABC transporter substrate-binding protein [Roseomonas acroporae]